ITDTLKGLALGAVGATLGAALMGGIASAMEQQQITAKLGAQLGATPAEAQRYGKIAGALYAQAITEDFEGAAETIRVVMGAGLVPASATNAQIQSIATHAQDLASTFDVDLTTSAQAAAAMMKNGLAKDGAEAFDLLTAGMQGLGPAGEDLVETFREYSPVFKQAGLSGSTALGLMRQAVQGGWTQDTDKIADAFKELQLRATEGSDGAVNALKSLGLNAKQIGDDIAAGGTKGEAAMGKVLDAMRKAGPQSQEVKQAVSALFGGPGEDLGAALFALDVNKARNSMSDAAGAADRMGESLRDNAATNLEQFKRGLTQSFVETLGGTVIPIITQFGGFLRDHQGEVKTAAVVLAALLVPALVLLGIQSLITGAQMAAAWLIGLGPIAWIGLAIGALVILIIAYWDQIEAFTLAAWDWIVGKLLWAKDAAVNAFMNWTLIGLLISHWTSIRNTAVTWWNATVGFVKGIPGRIRDAFLNWTLLGLIISHWTNIKTATVNKAGEMLAWVRTLPSRIGSAVGSLRNLLYGKGQDLIRGLLDGVRGMGGYLRSSLMSFAKSMIPGPIASALGIHSPSRVMRDQIGRWIPAGVVEGVEDGAPAVDAAMRNLVNVPTAGQAAAANTAALTGPGRSGGASASGGVLRIGSDGSALGDLIIDTLRRAVAAHGGDVQFAITGKAA
ncbi:phage tail tape measure protein, partial [Streptomyces griseoluteus]